MCIDLHQTGSVGEGSDHLQLIKFWLPCTPGKGVCGGAKFFGLVLLQSVRSVCISLSAFFIAYWLLLLAEILHAVLTLHYITPLVSELEPVLQT